MAGGKHIPNDIHIQGDTAYMVLTNRAGLAVAVTLFDAADVPKVRDYPHRWNASWSVTIQNYYVATSIWGDGRKRTVKFHRFLIDPPADLDVDHKNHNSLDNRRQNLRPATRQQNTQNFRPGAYQNTRGIRDLALHEYVWFERSRNAWRGYILHADRRRHIGLFPTREDAVRRITELREELQLQQSA